METTAQRCRRIIAALEELVEQEATALTNGDLTGVLALQDRTAALVDFLVSEVSGAGHLDLRTRLSALHTRRSQTSRLLAQRIESSREELHRMRSARVRVAQVAPAYGAAAAAGHRLQLVG